QYRSWPVALTLGTVEAARNNESTDIIVAFPGDSSISEIQSQVHAMFVMRAAVGVEPNPWTGGKVALAHKEFSNTAEVSRKVREDSILREILSRGLPSVCCYRYFPSDVGSRSRTRRLSKVSVATGIIPDPASDCWNLTYILFQYFSLSTQPPTPSKRL